MPKIKPHSLTYRDLSLKLKIFGVIEHPNVKRGKGSERILILSSGWDQATQKYRGPQFPVKCHGEGTEIYKQVINKILSRFNIDPAAFWKV